MLQIFKGQVLEAFSGSLFKGFLPSTKVEEVTTLPAIDWQGRKMPWLAYQQIVSFFRMVYKEHKAEAVVELLYDEDDKSSPWHIGAFPQEVTGGSVKVLKEDPDYAEALAEVRGVVVGSIHSHSSMAAFQSGVDLADEKKTDGLHITLGKLDEKKLDIHVRVMARGNEYPLPDLTDWIHMPAWVTNLPKPLQKSAAEYALAHCETDEGLVPEAWMARVKKPVYNVLVPASVYGLPGSQDNRNEAWYAGFGTHVKSLPVNVMNSDKLDQVFSWLEDWVYEFAENEEDCDDMMYHFDERLDKAKLVIEKTFADARRDTILAKHGLSKHETVVEQDLVSEYLP